MDDFYAAREDTIPTLQWTSIAPPFTETEQRDPMVPNGGLSSRAFL